MDQLLSSAKEPNFAHKPFYLKVWKQSEEKANMSSHMVA